MRSFCFASLTVLALAPLTAGCGGDSTHDDVQTGTFTLDVSGLPRPLADANSSIAFPIDLSEKTRKLTELEPAQIVEIYDRVGCWDGSEGQLEKTADAAGLPAGDAATVTAVDLDLRAGAAPADFSGVCIGFRSPSGGWHYDLTPVEPTGTGDVRHVHLALDGGPMDALEISFETNYPPTVVGIRFTAE